MESQEYVQIGRCINVIIGRKKLILSVFVVAVVVSSIVSLFLPKVYKATVSIMITPSAIGSAILPSEKYAIGRPKISFNTHEVLLR